MRKPMLVVRMVVQSGVGASLTVIHSGSGKTGLKVVVEKMAVGTVEDE